MDEKHYVIVVGARPNFVKLAPLMHEKKNHPHIKFTVIHTGQHYNKSMSRDFFKDLNIPKPDFQFNDEPLNCMAAKLSSYMTNEIDGVIVFGDTRSALAGALAAHSKGIKLIHIEAGLRSLDKTMPEETNRIVIDYLSTLLFTTERAADINLQAEWMKGVNVGNLMLETLENITKRQIFTVNRPGCILATIHRFENVNDRNKLSKIMKLLSGIDNVLLVLHPGTKKKLNEYNIPINVDTVGPQGYVSFIGLLMLSNGVITDSGGIQEEANYLGIPCATLRDNTERPSTLLGSNKLFSLDSSVEDIKAHLSRKFKRKPVDTKVAEKIFKFL